jgi:hypothetical protein
LRKYLIAVVAALTAIAFASVAIAQSPEATMKVKLSPKKAGTKKRPKNSKLTLSVKNNDVHKTAKQLDIQLPKTVVASGKGFKACKESKLASDGPAACPKAAIVGKGTAEAALGVDQASPQPLHFEVTAVVVGKKAIDFYLHSTTIAVNVVAPGRLKNTKKGQKLVVKIPQEAQQPAPGVYAGLVSLDTTLGAKRGKHKLIASTGCKRKKQKFSATVHFGANPVRPAGKVTTSASSKCK